MGKKNKQKKLAFKKETVRKLDTMGADQLRRAAGGGFAIYQYKTLGCAVFTTACMGTETNACIRTTTGTCACDPSYPCG